MACGKEGGFEDTLLSLRQSLICTHLESNGYGLADKQGSLPNSNRRSITAGGLQLKQHCAMSFNALGSLRPCCAFGCGNPCFWA
jgi:hypothetical protein